MKPTTSESEFLDQVIQLARIRGWRSAHFRPAKTRDGWRTAVSGDGAGWPDLFLIRGAEMLVAELKVGNRQLTGDQIIWLAAFRDAGVPAFEWRPENWNEIEIILEKGHD
jgi:hypothetical protein